MNAFKRMALMATVATYLLILMGGLVRVSGAGMGCPDWPQCYGRWIPPTSVDQLPPEVDPEQFNFRLAWTEYINRLLGMIVGLLIAVTAILALRYHRRTPRLLYPSIAAAVLVAFEGWQGSQVVASELKPIVVSAHMVLALVIVILLTYVAHQVHSRKETAAHPTLPANQQRWLVLLGAVSIAEVAFGIHVRETLEIIAAGFPSLTELDWLDRAGVGKHVHLFGGILLVCLTWLIMILILRAKKPLSPLVTRSARILLGITAVQLVVGLSFISWGRVPILQLLHMWLPTLYLGALVIMFLDASAHRRTV